MDDLDAEVGRATAMLRGKTLDWIARHRPAEVAVTFTDGTTLFVDAGSGAVELSVTGDDTDVRTQDIDGSEVRGGSEPPHAELLTPPHNYAVVQLPDRRFPGIVFQGDSLASLCERLARAVDGRITELESVKADLDDVLRSYMSTLQERSIELPFSYRPSS
jgi:hypothetical protein